MAIKTIDELTEVLAAGENDVLPIAVENNGSYTTKKIKASALGGSGGASAFVVTLTAGESGFTADKTIAETVAAANDGQIVTAVMSVGDGEFFVGQLVYVYDEGLMFLMLSENAFIRIDADIDSGGNDIWTYRVAPVSWQEAN